MMVDGINLYATYKSFVLHCNDKINFNCVKYNFKTKVSEQTFLKSRFKWQFMTMERKLAGTDFRYAVFNVFYLYGFTYINPQKFIQTLSKYLEVNQKDFLNNIFKKDLLYLKSVYNGSSKLFETSDLYPNIYQEYLDGKIDIQSTVLLNIFIKDVINTGTSRDIIAWPKYVKEMNKLKDLVGYFYNKNQVEALFSDHYLG